MLTIRFQNSFKADVKKLKKRQYNLDLLNQVILLLATGNPLPDRYREHILSGDYANLYECHIKPDWLLLYFKDDKELVLTLIRTGSHSDLFQYNVIRNNICRF